MSYDPFNKFQHPFHQNFADPQKVSNPTIATKEGGSIIERPKANLAPTGVALPRHLYTPAGAEPIDIRVAADIAASTITPALLMSFTCPKGGLAHFIAYAVFSDGILAANQQFIPRVNGGRVFQFQGDPNNNFRIDLGLGPDLTNNSLIHCQLSLQPGQTVEWFVLNLNLVDIAMGVRMSGYVDYTQKRIDAR
jgi:hypothetical protein